MTDTPTPDTGEDVAVLPEKEIRTDHYEVLVLLAGTDEDAAKTIVSDVKKILEASGAVVTLEDIWGTRNLAYTINKTKTGFYFVYEFDLTTDKTAELNEKLRIRKDISRFMLVKKPTWTKQQLVEREQLRQSLLSQKGEDDDDQDKPERKSTPIEAVKTPEPTKVQTPVEAIKLEPVVEAAPAAQPKKPTADADTALADIDAKIDAILKDDLNV